MAEQQAEKLECADGTVKLCRNVKFPHGAQELGTGDRMVVQHGSGYEEDVVIIQEGGKYKVKGWVRHLETQTPSPAGPATCTVSESLADLDADTEKRLLAIYKMFPEQATR